MRKRCTVVGCNPVLDEKTAEAHKEETGHHTANWPVRSAAGEKKARKRNRSGYYAKYNVGDRHPAVRGIDGYNSDAVESYSEGIHPFSEEAFE